MCSRTPDAVYLPKPALPPLPLAEAVKRYELAQKPVNPPTPILPIKFSDIVKSEHLRVIEDHNRVHCVPKAFASKLNGERVQAAFGFRKYGNFFGIILKFFGYAFKAQHEGKTLYINKKSFCVCMIRFRAREILGEMQAQESSRKALVEGLEKEKNTLDKKMTEVTAQLKRASERLKRTLQEISRKGFIAINATGDNQNYCPTALSNRCAEESYECFQLKAEKASLQVQVNGVVLKISAAQRNMSIQSDAQRQADRSRYLQENFSNLKIEKIVSKNASRPVVTKVLDIQETFKHVFKQNQNVDLTELYVKMAEENRKRIHDITFTRFDEGTVHIKS